MRMTCIWASLVLLGSLVDARAAQGDAPLLDAVRAGDTASVRVLLAQGADVNAAEADGTTALHWASYRDDATTVERLLSAGADVEAANRYGARPLSLAAAGGYAQTLAALLEAGADPTLMTAGAPPILSAARTGNVEAVRVLARHGADVNAKETLRGQTALMWAAAEDHPAVAQALIDLGADVNASSDSDGLERLEARRRDEDATFNLRNPEGGFTPLVFAARQGALETARVLVASGANVHETALAGSSALLIAINNYHYELAAFLVDSGADPGATDPDGYTALHAAVRAENPAPVFDRVRIRIPGNRSDGSRRARQVPHRPGRRSRCTTRAGEASGSNRHQQDYRSSHRLHREPGRGNAVRVGGFCPRRGGHAAARRPRR